MLVRSIVRGAEERGTEPSVSAFLVIGEGEDQVTVHYSDSEEFQTGRSFRIRLTERVRIRNCKRGEV